MRFSSGSRRSATLGSRYAGLVLLSCLACCAPDCGLFCPEYTWGYARTVMVYVDDARGNPVPIDSASFTQDFDTHTCIAAAESTGVGCHETDGGVGTLSVQVQGQTLTREVRVGVTSKDSCDSTQEEELRLPGPGCPKPHGVAIQGRLLDARRNEVQGGTVTARLYGREERCVVEGARFSCSSMASYGATYSLSARFATSRAQKDVFVRADACQVMPADGTFNLAEPDCDPERRPSNTAVVVPVRLASVAAVEVEIFDQDGHSAACTTISMLSTTDLEYECPGLTPTGGGRYRVEVRVGNRSQSAEVDVLDDGCSASVTWLQFAF